MNRWNSFKSLVLLSLFSVSFLLMGAVCGEVNEFPTVVKSTFPHSKSVRPFEFNISETLVKSGIKPVNGRLPKNAPPFVTVSYRDSINLKDMGGGDLEKYKEKLEIYINRLEVSAEENTLNYPIQGLKIYLINGNSEVLLATTKGIGSGEEGLFPTPSWELAGLKTLKTAIRSGKLEFKAVALVPLKAGGPFPKGKVSVKITFEFTVRFSII